MSKKTILCDLDSIIADFYFGILDAYHLETGDTAPDDALGCWDAKLPNGKDCYSYFSQPGFFRGLKPIPGAREFIGAAKAEGHDVLIVTAATLSHAPGEKFDWLSEHLPDFDRSQVIFARRKEMILGDVLIDDHSHNAGAYRRQHPGALVVGIQYPYNVGTPEAFTHLVPSYLDFRAAWTQVSNLVLD